MNVLTPLDSHYHLFVEHVQTIHINLLFLIIKLTGLHPYNNNCFTFELNSLNFVLLLYTFDVHTLSVILKATLALPSLSLTSSSVSPVLLTTFPRYVNSETSSVGPDINDTPLMFSFFIDFTLSLIVGDALQLGR